MSPTTTNTLRCLAGGLLLSAGIGVSAAEVEGIDLPDTATVDGQALTLNGAGLRSKFFVRVYVGALYLRDRTTSAQRAIDTPPPKRVALHMIYDDLSAEKVTEAWSEGFEANHSDDALGALAARIERFNAMWPALAAGDVVHVDVAAGETRVSINGEGRGAIEGDDFGKAVLRIWLGEEPADGDLKAGMLGS